MIESLTINLGLWGPLDRPQRPAEAPVPRLGTSGFRKSDLITPLFTVFNAKSAHLDPRQPPLGGSDHSESEPHLLGPHEVLTSAEPQSVIREMGTGFLSGFVKIK